MTPSEAFNRALKEHTPTGWPQHYFLIVECTVKDFAGRWHYVDGEFWECEVAGINGRHSASSDSGLFLLKRCNEERLYREIENDTITLVRYPKAAYKKVFPELIIDFYTMATKKKQPAALAKSRLLRATDEISKDLAVLKTWLEAKGLEPDIDLDSTIAWVEVVEDEYHDQNTLLDELEEEKGDQAKEIQQLKENIEEKDEEIEELELNRPESFIAHKEIRYSTTNPLDQQLMEELAKCLEYGQPLRLLDWLETYQLM